MATTPRTRSLAPRRAGRLVVFAGPCLAPLCAARRRELLAGAELCPPARRGDLLGQLDGSPRPPTLVLLDGYYYDVPAVTHKEVLYCLEAGARVLGAASLGALRAAELEPFGMEGVGEIFEAYRRGALEGDDEVALLHLGAEDGFRPVSVALVELRWALARLLARGAAEPDGAAELLAAAGALAFGERRPRTLRDLASRALGAAGARRLDRELAARSIKAEDAERALERARGPAEKRPERPEPGSPAASPPSPPVPPVVDTVFLRSDLGRHAAIAVGPQGPAPGAATPLLRAWWAAQLLHPGAPAWVEGVRRRFLLAHAAREEGLEVAAGALEAHAARLAGRLAARSDGAANRPSLPAVEIRREARLRAEAEAARRSLGGPDGALARLARALGLPATGARGALLELLEAEHELLPGWVLERAFAFSPALPAAVAAARAVDEVERAFRAWAGERTIPRREVLAVAAELWGSTPGEALREGLRRGLFDVSGLHPGLAEAVRWVAPAHRLGRPINDYPERRDALRRAPLAGRRLRPTAR